MVSNWLAHSGRLAEADPARGELGRGGLLAACRPGAGCGRVFGHRADRSRFRNQDRGSDTQLYSLVVAVMIALTMAFGRPILAAFPWAGWVR
jgi:hypothetical protein